MVPPLTVMPPVLAKLPVKISVLPVLVILPEPAKLAEMVVVLLALLKLNVLPTSKPLLVEVIVPPKPELGIDTTPDVCEKSPRFNVPPLTVMSPVPNALATPAVKVPSDIVVKPAYVFDAPVSVRLPAHCLVNLALLPEMLPA